MYFWYVNDLIKDLQADRVSEKDKMKYYLVTSLLMTVGGREWDIIVTIPQLIILVCGIILCYKVNAQNDNKDFVARIICLGFTISIRLIILIIIPAFVCFYILPPAIFENKMVFKVFDICLLIIYYVYLYKCIEEVSTNAGQAEQTEKSVKEIKVPPL
jgi:hypothetical protein